jgi:hypothetical protein
MTKAKMPPIFRYLGIVPLPQAANDSTYTVEGILMNIDGAHALIANDNDGLATNDKMLNAAVENLPSM